MNKDFFPFFNSTKTVYLDNAATTQKPQVVLDSINEYYTKYCANTHRSNYGAANKATLLYERSRTILKKFINARDEKEIIFTKGVTEAINMIASSFGKKFKTIIISSLEHHSNIVPWHMQGRSLHKGLEVVKYKKNLEFNFKNFEELLKNNPNSLVSITHVSNAFGVIHDIKKIALLTHKYKSFLLVDGAQSLAHFEVDVQDLDVDFYAISSHKTFGPTGVGAIYIKKSLLENIDYYQTGGATINDVSFTKTTMLESPYAFEAGTQNIAGVIGFGTALEFLDEMGIKNIEQSEKKLYKYLQKKLENEIDDVIFYNHTSNAIGSKSFNIKNINCEDIGILLDKMNIAIRAGHHCAQPIMKALNIEGTIRVSIAFYNTKKDIDKLIQAIQKAQNILKD